MPQLNTVILDNIHLLFILLFGCNFIITFLDLIEADINKIIKIVNIK